jgi:hypothetical protein
MATEVSENTKLTLDLKTLGIVVGFTISLATMYFTLKSEIALAMTEPKPEVSSIEFQYKDELVRSTIEKIDLDVTTVKGDVSEIKESLAKMEERLYEISKTR